MAWIRLLLFVALGATGIAAPGHAETRLPSVGGSGANPCVQAKLARAAGRPFDAEMARCFASLPPD